ncbi:MAG TPA: hypothetical protein VKZ79_22660 [Alphaproteobacteria bacterium]|nr:hypothetical protein [Alphaproteobacteria bacterium]
MKFICDAPGGKAWFRIETELEAQQESELMQHAVEKYFRREWEKAAQSYRPSAASSYIERDIGLNDHIQRQMPLFMTLRDAEGNGLATAMLPPGGRSATATGFRIIIVGRSNGDPYPSEGQAIGALAKEFGLTLDRDSCFPYA